MDDLTVRIRFRIPPSEKLGIKRGEAVYRAADFPAVALVAADSEADISDSEWLVLRSEGWQSEEEADAAAERLLDALRLALSRFGMSADLGRRGPQSGVFRSALRRMTEAAERPVLNDIHGSMVFPTAPKPVFARAGTASLLRTLQPERWERAFIFALEGAYELTERERVAFDVYDAAFWVRESQDARFALLFAAVEVLLEEAPRPESSVQHVEHLIELTEAAELEPGEVDSLCGSLRWLQGHSIRTTGRALVRNRLGDRTYGDMVAERFFLACYDLRNRLLHGRLPFPTRQEVGRLAAPLEKMVGDLIAGPTLELDV